ncbi:MULTISPECIES: Qat anti-phage system TatD family nuclease QatD [unclassified Methylobacterium]|uniref:Qat anti-phage system TatD family nuclease QatD n=1 Tax=unclassified Methylobacterium TaxID=2615210 RepID=UPI0006FC9707|nr:MULTISPECIES: Qat anti-phage system TatD family nuclease QatD [unclassified Methylobacterium]KQO59659.1 hydrolase TatD [Methylobacterium sp. Leaf87]KQP60949.1 hydrolase TatD [Methylobacterium sp. Leaf112]
MIDFHCHLDLYPEPAKVVAEVAKRGMYVLAVTTTPRAFEGNLRFVGSNRRIRVAVGLHPELVGERHAEVGLVCAALLRTRYVGEVGLDGSPQHWGTFATQRNVLRTIFKACCDQGGRVISLHSRMAVQAVLDEIEQAGPIGTPVMHWFGGTPDEMVRASGLGCWFSVGPAMLNSKKGRLLAAGMPRDRVLPETDGPFGQSRGKPLTPWDCELVIPILADLWDMPLSAVEALMSDNLRRLVI